ncbi:MAG: aminopeptidase [Anaerolineaceae bacterium]|nr:aminopeptidase [Anaerolineaceae bacterium]
MASDFDQSLSNYAELIVKVGLNMRAGQRLVIQAPIQAAELVRKVTVSAYKAGVRYVDVLWQDDLINLARYQFAPRDSFEEFPLYLAKGLEEYGRSGDAFLRIYSEDPDLLKDQDPQLIALANKSMATALKKYAEYEMSGYFNWCVVGMPIASWAAKVFPEIGEQDRIEKLWDTIFKVCRLNQGDPVAAWQQHILDLVARGDYLNQKAYTAIRFRSPGTDLTVGLPDGHQWISGQSTAKNGIPFVANIPTEEVFTLPHKDRTEGVVTSTRPLSIAGSLLEDFSLTFEKGRVVNYNISKNEAVLRNLIETDEGSHHLGEVSLVPNNSPISQSGILFYNTLFDENAACHIALGKAYAVTLKGGDSLSEEEFAAAGGNDSLYHVDFMIGSAETDVDGIRPDGQVEAVLRGGEWAFKVNG